MYIFELLQKTAEWKWTRDLQWAEFHIKENHYQVGFFFLPNGKLFVGFGLVNPETGSWEEGNTGTGSAFLVFSTVIDIFKDYARREKPESVVIPAVPEREVLYTRMISRIAPDLGYELSNRETSHFVDYGNVVFLEIVRKDLQ